MKSEHMKIIKQTIFTKTHLAGRSYALVTFAIPVLQPPCEAKNRITSHLPITKMPFQITL